MKVAEYKDEGKTWPVVLCQWCRAAATKRRNLTSRPSEAAKHGAFEKFDQRFKDGEPKPFLFT